MADRKRYQSLAVVEAQLAQPLLSQGALSPAMIVNRKQLGESPDGLLFSSRYRFAAVVRLEESRTCSLDPLTFRKQIILSEQ